MSETAIYFTTLTVSMKNKKRLFEFVVIVAEQ